MAKQEMKNSNIMRVFATAGTLLIALVFGCASQALQKDSLKDTNAPRETPSPAITEEKVSGRSAPLHLAGVRRTIKTTRYECDIRGGEYTALGEILPQDMVECLLPGKMRKYGTRGPSSKILASVYDYLYSVGTEKPLYGLYSYVLLPAPAPRAEHFLEELFKTTQFVELSGINSGNLNTIYLPTKADRLSSLVPKIKDGSAPPARWFVTEIYDYALAQRLLAQICSAPSEEISDVCDTDLSRGPYLFTFPRPASALSPVPPPYLFVDLSNVHERAFSEFITAYKEQVKRPDYSDLARIDNLRLRILSIVLTAADWIDPIKGAIAGTVHMTEEDKTDK